MRETSLIIAVRRARLIRALAVPTKQIKHNKELSDAPTLTQEIGKINIRQRAPLV
jgi:hypothetical protein